MKNFVESFNSYSYHLVDMSLSASKGLVKRLSKAGESVTSTGLGIFQWGTSPENYSEAEPLEEVTINETISTELSKQSSKHSQVTVVGGDLKIDEIESNQLSANPSREAQALLFF